MPLAESDLNSIIPDGIDPENPGIYADLLSDLQGNILKGHGRDRSIHLFLKFTGSVDDIKDWIQAFGATYVTSAAQQAQQSKLYKQWLRKGAVPKTKIFDTTFANFFLSRAGYQYLDTSLRVPRDEFFKYGMKADSVKGYLADPDVSAWEAGYQKDLHGLILIAHDNLETLNAVAGELIESLDSLAEVVQQEAGFVLRNPDNNQVIEHFGFADGVSQPLFIKSDVDKAKEDGLEQWDPRAPLSTVLVQDPNGTGPDSYGSYLVYRKLEQNVEAFRAAEQALAEKLQVTPDLAGAYMVGRFKDGTPVTLSNTPGGEETNNFNYDADPADFGLDPKPSKCPFHAHIRKTNPRGDTSRVNSAPDAAAELERERGHRIARRGISYGVEDPSLAPKDGSGLLFLCFQGNIAGQFAFVQADWANQNNFVKVNVGNDPIIGVKADGEADPNIAGNRQWLTQWGQTDSEAERDLLGEGNEFEIWVHLQGGGFFFAPSISFLTSLPGQE